MNDRKPENGSVSRVGSADVVDDVVEGISDEKVLDEVILGEVSMLLIEEVVEIIAEELVSVADVLSDDEVSEGLVEEAVSVTVMLSVDEISEELGEELVEEIAAEDSVLDVVELSRIVEEIVEDRATELVVG
ncbi:hypothetical protein Daesc_009601 [Daldinia eschscholtzii]|uniref:Uncharacterized protein n=1 Tax=Daldinia eschscholtzii TaxID=292717 RepID=A0AAX6MA52_9PEZI